MMSRQDSTSAREEEHYDRRLLSGDRRSGGPGMRKLERKMENLSKTVHTLRKRMNQQSRERHPEGTFPPVLQERQTTRAPGELRDYLNKKKPMSQAPSRRGLKRLWKTVFGSKADEASQPAEPEGSLPPGTGEGRRRASAHQKTQRLSGHNKPERTVLREEKHSGQLAFTDSITSILRQIKDEEFLRWPRALKNPEGGDQWEYCHYHCCHGHDTEECMKLQAEINRLMAEGYLDRFLSRPGHDPRPAGHSRSRHPQRHGQDRLGTRLTHS